MAKVVEIAISKKFSGQMEVVSSVETAAGKGLINDRYFKNNNDKRNQITLIEIENINYYNKISETLISPKNFRRNIITEGVELNKLLGLEFLVGNVKLRTYDLCRPCKSLQESFKQTNTIRELMKKGGIRCEIVTNGTIYVGDIIKIGK